MAQLRAEPAFFARKFPDDPLAPIRIQVLAELVGNFGRNAERLPAAAFISLIVPLIVFFSLQRFFVRGLLAGSTKG